MSDLLQCILVGCPESPPADLPFDSASGDAFGGLGDSRAGLAAADALASLPSLLSPQVGDHGS
ncbi:hypothetical protein [Streptomyces sp. NPDC002205]|uniref:hypothetical protein n=1 Tax=Streptomyces sp. NPDC002205 TaxID=3154411 RepID=UPI003329E37E